MNDYEKVHNRVLLALSIVAALAIVMFYFCPLIILAEHRFWVPAWLVTSCWHGIRFVANNPEIIYMILGVGALGALLAMVSYRDGNKASIKGIQSVSSHVRK